MGRGMDDRYIYGEKRGRRSAEFWGAVAVLSVFVLMLVSVGYLLSSATSKSERVAPSTPTARPEPPPRAYEPLPHDQSPPPRRQPSAIDHQRQQAAIAARVQQENQATLQSMMETCRFWAQRRQQRGGEDNYRMACSRARAFASEVGLPVPSLPATNNIAPQRAPASPSIAPSAPSTPRTVVPTWQNMHIDTSGCEARYREGSIAYRYCRARTSREMREQCTALRRDLQSVASDRFERAQAYMRAYCLAADRYQIVR